MMNGPGILAQIGEKDGCALWRVLQPFAALQAIGYPAEWDFKDAPDDGRTPESVRQYRHSVKLAAVATRMDAVLLPRQSWHMVDKPMEVNWFRALHNAGKCIIYEVDDDMFSEGFAKRLMLLHNHTRAEADERRMCIFDTLKRCDGVTVSSQRLATTVREFTDKPVVVVPNAIDIAWWRRVQRLGHKITPGLTIGWTGGSRPDRDIEQMVVAWGRIAARFPEVHFLVQGYQPDIIVNSVPADRLTLLPWMPLEEYPLGVANIDIGCCPLSDSAFNRAKTPIKSWEYAVSGAAVVASPTIYKQVITPGLDGYICETADEWETALAALVMDADLRRRMNGWLLDKVERQHSLEGNLWRWPAAWAEIVDHFRAHRPILLPIREFISGTVSDWGGGLRT